MRKGKEADESANSGDSLLRYSEELDIRCPRSIEG